MLSGRVPDSPVFYAGRAGDSPFQFGEIIPAGTVLVKPVLAWFHPDTAHEAAIPFDYAVVGTAAGLVVVDKPCFLPATSNGRLVRETVQTRLRVRYRNPDIVPVHRLDRLTCGLLACATDVAARGFYQQQFAERTARKTYRARLCAEPGIGSEWQEIVLPMRRVPGQRAVEVAVGGVETRTHVRALDSRLVELQPLTGFTHQLRVVCAYLGAPIEGDDTYPVDVGLQLHNYSTPMKLCATRLELREWGSDRRLVWTSPRVAESDFRVSRE
ncbi:23S RNA-specific pseudouridylate synthase [Corynebacterium epidermidicanis]|uniref:RNA pseudouridylate synthase n=2 Tax=Corynebacterium epidermidicanis TaxID=1050174 RepID=A0A0G3GQH5_9CORY|nr:23S RNA-specific pseudouridylate synthase [Corynebacterium epidermidicanis]